MQPPENPTGDGSVPPVSATSASAPGLRPSRVLVVEDARHISRLLEFVLQKEGYQVTVASSAEQALVDIEICRPDALLLDFVLPGMSGLEFLQKIRLNPAYSRCVVIVLSSKWLQEADAQMMQGISAQFSKPIAPSSLLRKLRELGVDKCMPENQ